jgi:hypothetical protein
MSRREKFGFGTNIVRFPPTSQSLCYDSEPHYYSSFAQLRPNDYGIGPRAGGYPRAEGTKERVDLILPRWPENDERLQSAARKRVSGTASQSRSSTPSLPVTPGPGYYDTDRKPVKRLQPSAIMLCATSVAARDSFLKNRLTKALTSVALSQADQEQMANRPLSYSQPQSLLTRSFNAKINSASSKSIQKVHSPIPSRTSSSYLQSYPSFGSVTSLQSSQCL